MGSTESYATHTDTFPLDYGESHYIGPIRADQPNSQGWTNGMPHSKYSYSDLAFHLLTLLQPPGSSSSHTTRRLTRPEPIHESPRTACSSGPGRILTTQTRPTLPTLDPRIGSTPMTTSTLLYCSPLPPRSPSPAAPTGAHGHSQPVCPS